MFIVTREWALNNLVGGQYYSIAAPLVLNTAGYDPSHLLRQICTTYCVSEIYTKWTHSITLNVLKRIKCKFKYNIIFNINKFNVIHK